MIKAPTHPKANPPQAWSLQAPALREAYKDFRQSRQALQCSPATLAFYDYTAAAFLAWTESHGVTAPAGVTVRLVREYLAQLGADGKANSTVHDHARAMKTLFGFWREEGYLPAPIDFKLPKLYRKRQPMLTADEVVRLLSLVKSPRDRALIQFLADSGLRRAEVCALNCGDVDAATGRVRVKRGKGAKPRSAVIGAAARQALLNYRADLPSLRNADAPVFLSRSGSRLTGGGVLLIFRRLWKTTGIHVTPHALRRTFATLALRSGMNVLHLQALLGHASLEMVERYVQLIDDDLVEAHRAHSPIDNLDRLKRAMPAPEVVAQLPA